MDVNSVNLSAQKYNFQKPEKIEKSEKLEDELNPVEKTLVNSVAPARRIIGLPDMIKSGDTIAAAGLAGLTIVSLPEDCRDLKAAYNHSACVLRKKRLSVPYNYRKYQHDFSFFRGTLLHEAMKRIKSERGKRIVAKIYNADKTVYNTRFGKWIQKLLGIKNGKIVKSKVKDLFGHEIPVQQIIVKRDFIGLKDLTARAMKRTSILGVAFMGMLELPKIIKSVFKGKDSKEKAKSLGIQSMKSLMNVLGITVGMGYLGAIGAKKFGALGSLIGMGLGVLSGAAASKELQNLIFDKKQK